MTSEDTPPPFPSIVGRALLVSDDSTIVEQLTHCVQRFAISADVCPDVPTATSLINTRKFEAIFVDFALGHGAQPILERIRLSPSNQSSVTFALVDSHVHAEFGVQPNFVMQKPLTDILIGTTLKAALGLIIRDYRRYFRCPLAVPVVLGIDGTAQILCKVMNISEGGLAINTSVTFKPGAQVNARFALPGQPDTLDVAAEVCWCDNKGRAGLQFRSVPPEQKVRLQGWLSNRIEQGLPESAARLFQKAQ